MQTILVVDKKDLKLILDALDKWSEGSKERVDEAMDLLHRIMSKDRRDNWKYIGKQ